MAEPTPSPNLLEKLNEMIARNSVDYDSWRFLISDIETAFPDDVDKLSLAYDTFLSKFPLCHWHLEKYVYLKAKLCGETEAIKVFENGAAVAMYSIGFWVTYFTFGTACFSDPEDVRRLFGRAISCVGRDYLCHVLWDKYMKYEFEHEGWSFLAQSYVEALRFPTKKLRYYYENFKQFVANLEEEMGNEMNCDIEANQVTDPSTAIITSRDEVSLVVKDLLDSSDKVLKSKALLRYRSIGEELYKEASQLDAKVKCFEKNVQRRYFSANPLDEDQLRNWHLYLDFIEKQDDLDSAVKLYERCLIPCATYLEFWMRYVEFLESKRGTELCLSAVDRATQIFLKNVPEMHLFKARFKERIKDINGASEALLLCDTKSDSSFVEIIAAKANMERRLGNLDEASAIYEKALKTVTEKQKVQIIPSLYSRFARFTFMATGSADAARDILIEGIQKVPTSCLLLKELITFAMTHEGASQVSIIDSVVADSISRESDEYEGWNSHERESISSLLLQFVDLCGSVHDYGKAWSRHIKLFPQFLRLKPTYNDSKPLHYETALVKLITDSTEASQVSKNDDGKEDHEFRCPKEPMSLETTTTQENESHELIPMSFDEHETKRSGPVSSENPSPNASNVNLDSFPDSMAIQTTEPLCVPEPEEAKIRNDHGVTDPNNSPTQPRFTDTAATPNTTTSKEVPPLPVSHPPQNTHQSGLLTSPNPNQTPQNMDSGQMLQYYYQQQQFIQQQYHMQQQYSNQQQQPYQQQNQQYMQYYAQQNQPLPYQPGPQQMQHYGYQQPTVQGQQFLLGQYQQYQQNYQHFPNQQQPSNLPVQEQNLYQVPMDGQDAQSQQHHQAKNEKEKTPETA